jgi:hypothetical protein
VQTFIIRATGPLKLLRTRGSDRRAELRLTRGSGQPLSTARRPTGKSPASELRIRHSQDLGLPASALNMIIVSESSAKATQPVRTGRYTPAHRPSSAARTDTHRYANARRIRVHTEEVNRSRSGSLGPPAGRAPGWPRAGHEKWWVTRGACIPSRRHRGVASLGSGSSSVSASGAQLDPDPRPASRQARRRDGIPASVPLSCGGLTLRVCH